MNYKENKIDPDEVVVDGLVVLYTLSRQLLTRLLIIVELFLISTNMVTLGLLT